MSDPVVEVEVTGYGLALAGESARLPMRCGRRPPDTL
jgi:hypothetical protein